MRVGAETQWKWKHQRKQLSHSELPSVDFINWSLICCYVNWFSKVSDITWFQEEWNSIHTQNFSLMPLLTYKHVTAITKWGKASTYFEGDEQVWNHFTQYTQWRPLQLNYIKSICFSETFHTNRTKSLDFRSLRKQSLKNKGSTISTDSTTNKQKIWHQKTLLIA